MNGKLCLLILLTFPNNSVVSGLDCNAALKALGEETRLRMLRLLFKEPLSVTEITECLQASQYNVSKHLRIMREAGLLEVKQGHPRRKLGRHLSPWGWARSNWHVIQALERRGPRKIPEV
jgi:DNA-binding transcriptional ArsR family regulator